MASPSSGRPASIAPTYADPSCLEERSAAMAAESLPDPPSLTVLVYSDDAAVRQSIWLAVGRRPTPDLGRIEYVEVDTGEAVIAAVDAGGIDLCVLDGESWPVGGMGISRQLKSEIPDCPPVLVTVGRRDDAWLATWSLADAVLQHPLDPVLVADTVARLLRDRVGALATQQGQEGV